MKKTVYKIIAVLFALTLVLSTCICLTACDKDGGNDREHFSEETTYYLTSGEAVGMQVANFLSYEKTFIKFYPNGKMCLQVTPNSVIMAAASLYLYNNRENLAGISLSDMERYTSEVLPGESFFALVSALGKLGNSIGLKINGIDFEDEDTQAVFEEFNETHVIPASFTLPADLNVTIEADYALCEVPSDFREEPFKAVYLGDYDDLSGDPYIILTRYIDKNGKEAIFLANEILAMRIDFSMK